jgi:Mrp family chromosome partitioning ATPase
MSRNFDLLRKLGKDQDLLGPTDVPVRPEEERSTPLESSSELGAALGASIDALTGPRVQVEGPMYSPEEAKNFPGLEEINQVVQQVFLAQGADAPRMVVFASPEPGTGCSWICAHVADVLAQRTAGRVCVVDANLRTPGLARFYNVKLETGLAEALQQPEPIRQFVSPLTRPNLWIVGSGAVGDGAGMVTSDRMRLRMAELRSEFDFVLLDTAAMESCGDALSIAANADGVVLVLKAHATRKQNARKAIRDFQGAHSKVLGAVLNQRTYPIPEIIYDRL